MQDKIKGRPTKGKENLKAYSLRLEESTAEKLDLIAAEEREKTGYNVDRSDIVRRAVKDFIQRYEKG